MRHRHSGHGPSTPYLPGPRAKGRCPARSWGPASPPRTCTCPSRTAHAGRTRRMPPRRTRRPPSPRRTGTRRAGTRRARCTGQGTAAGLRGRRRPCCQSSRPHQSWAHSCIRRRHTCHGRSTTRPRSLRGIRRTRSRGRATPPRTGSTPPRTAHARSNRSDSASPSTSLPSTRLHSRTSRCGRRYRGRRTRVGTRRCRTRHQPRSRRRGRRRSGTRRARCSGRGKCPGCSRHQPSLARTRTRPPRMRHAVRAAPQRGSLCCCR